MMSRFPLDKFLLVIIFWLAQWTYHEFSLDKAERDYPMAVQKSGFFKTADEFSYTVPVKNFLEQGEWKDNDSERSSYYRRSPGYGVIMLPILVFSPNHEPGGLLLHFQFLLQALLVLLVYKALLEYVQKLSALVVVFFFALWWLGVNMAGFVLTEALTPMLVICYSVFALKKGPVNRVSLLSLSLLILVKPIFLLLLFAVLLTTRILRLVSWKKTVLYFVLAILPLSCWELRNQVHHKPFDGLSQVLHPVYDAGNKDIWRLPHEALYRLVKLSDPSPERFHQWVENFQKQQEFQPSLCRFLGNEVCEQIGQEKLRSWEHSYFLSLSEVEHNASRHIYSERELALAHDMNNYAKGYASSNLWKVYIADPVKHSFNSFTHSYLTGPFFWDSKYSVPLRLCSYLSVILSFFSFVFMLIAPLLMLRKKFNAKHVQENELSIMLVISLFSLGYLFYLFWIQRGIEMRYLLPLLPLGVINMIIAITSLFKGRMPSNVIAGDQ